MVRKLREYLLRTLLNHNQLLELAKQAVETAIEENEETASCLLKNN